MGAQHRWLWLLLFMFIKILEIRTKELRVVCYYTNWSVYRPGTAKFSPQNINPYLCTHLVYAFGGFTKENTLKPFDKYQDIEKGGYAKFTGLKTYNKNLKTMLAIGGWNEGSSRFSPMVASAERRKELVKNVVKFLRQNHFDGLDLDWEYPSFRDGGKTRDRDNYAQLVQELREEFERESGKTGRQRLILTMAVPAGIEYINKGYDVPKLMKYLDWMNILSYDYHSAFEPSVNHHAPLYPLEEDNEYNYDTDLNIDHTIQHYLKAGAISDKLVLGIPTYGRSYTLFNPDANDIGAPADGPGEMGDATRENGYLAYYEICEAVNSGEWNVVQPNDDAMGPYAYKENQWVGYDDEAIARKKSQYVADKDLGGIMFWSIDNDDFRGTCHNKSYPIIEAAKEALVEALGIGEENAIQKSSKNTKPRNSRVRNKLLKTTDEPSTERTRNSGGRQGQGDSSSGNSSKRRPTVGIQQGRTNTKEKSKSSRRRRPESRKSSTESYEPERSSGSSLVVTTPSYITPEPPTTPDPGGDFKCEDEGFYPHPRDCKRYFWCLSGPSELGIIAHQFTCPAGLYFNKAASSCDYTQNVLCKQKTKPASTTVTTSKPSTSSKSEAVTKKPENAFVFTTRRPAPKITAATSKTTFVSTSTTPEYEEYEDEDEPEDSNDPETESEDPRVIKELLELIKKAGGIEELEKQLNFKGDPSPESGSTTTSSINSKLYQRVLAKTKLVNPSGSPQNSLYTTLNRNRNSRGPQNEGLSLTSTNEESSSKSAFRPKYSTISRSRTSKVEEPTDEKEEEEEDKEEQPTSQGKPKYVSLRRNRVSTTAGPDLEEDEDEEPVVKKSDPTTTSKSAYVTLRRTRPTTEAIADEEDEEKESLDRKVLGEEDVPETSPNYITLNRNRGTPTEATTSRYKEIRRSTTAPAPVTEDVDEDKQNEFTTYVSPTTTTTATTTTQITNSKITNTLLTRINDEPLSHTLSFETTTPSPSSQSPSNSSEAPKSAIIEPQLLEPRPFSVSNYLRSTTVKTTPTTTMTTTTVEPTETTKRIRRPGSRYRPENRRTGSTYTTHPTRSVYRTRPTRRPTLSRTTTAAYSSGTSGNTSSTTESRVSGTRAPLRVAVNRFRTGTRRHFLSSTTTTTTTELPALPSLVKSRNLENDQSIESSNQDSKEQQHKTPSDTNTEFADLALALHNIQNAPLPLPSTPKTESGREVRKFRVQTANSILEDSKPKLAEVEQQIDKVQISTPRPFHPVPVITTLRPVRPATTTIRPQLTKQTTPKRQPQIYDKIQPGVQAYTYKPITDYDYYDDGHARISIPEHSKVLIHSSGVIQCLDQGNFPHPVSCKKFISCAKMETGEVLGWEYTCPKNLSFDPIGGICNWSAGLGCHD